MTRPARMTSNAKPIQDANDLSVLLMLAGTSGIWGYNPTTKTVMARVTKDRRVLLSGLGERGRDVVVDLAAITRWENPGYLEFCLGLWWEADDGWDTAHPLIQLAYEAPLSEGVESDHDQPEDEPGSP